MHLLEYSLTLFRPCTAIAVQLLYHSGRESDYFAALIDLSSAPRQAQIAVICVPRLAGAEQQRILQNGDLVWKAGSDPARTAAGPLVGPAVSFGG
jgi:hypothetical protein